MDTHLLIGVHVVGRDQHALKLQQILSIHGCQIRTRIGLHDVHDEYCSPNGLIVLDTVESPETQNLVEELKRLDGVDVQTMMFAH